MAKTILFVDEEHFARKALKRSFRDMRAEWDMQFAATVDEGLAILDQTPIEVLITEVVFKGQSGIDFLNAVRGRHPSIVRIILSGYVDQSVILESVDLAHQFLSKPCDDRQLKTTITRAFLVKGLLAQESLKKVVASIGSLPSLPALYTELLNELQSDDPSISKIGETIAKDIGFTAKLLKTVNSSFFGLAQRITHPTKAVALLGLDLVQSIILASGTFERFQNIKIKGFSLEQLWDHAMTTAVLSRAIAREAGRDRKDIETAFMAGILHDVGKLLVAAHLPEQFKAIVNQIQTQEQAMADAETAVLGTTHAPIGAYLLGLWGLPDAIIEATAFHHTPSNASINGLNSAGLVHIANAFAHNSAALGDSQSPIAGLDYHYLEAIGQTGHLQQWRHICNDLTESRSSKSQHKNQIRQ